MPSHKDMVAAVIVPAKANLDQALADLERLPASATPTGGEPSTGYGLAVAKELMSQLGGKIWCDSQPGQGACFSIRLPIDREGPSERQ